MGKTVKQSEKEHLQADTSAKHHRTFPDYEVHFPAKFLRLIHKGMWLTRQQQENDAVTGKKENAENDVVTEKEKNVCNDDAPGIDGLYKSMAPHFDRRPTKAARTGVDQQ
ncbi:hypothetical protein RIF29_09657 [Crotalaria pallida]|uniref:Uncharacterized protein n=1 Tax=Crotalaria pallida TaxID=3830 RepID=A0AAN9IJJ5_CROPI